MTHESHIHMFIYLYWFMKCYIYIYIYTYICIYIYIIYYIYILFLAPDFNRDSWLTEKFKLGLDFPNVSGPTVENYKVNVGCLLNIF